MADHSKDTEDKKPHEKFKTSAVTNKAKRFTLMNDDDLNMYFITDQIAAMAFPWPSSIPGISKNIMSELKRFLDKSHPKKHRVYNLCQEKKYDHKRLDGRVVEYDLEYGAAPNFNILLDICNNLDKFFEEDACNFAVIHSRKAKGRLAVVIACWLLYSKRCTTASEALRLFKNKRCGHMTEDQKASIVLPSQFRYVSYFERHIEAGVPYNPPVMYLYSIHMHTLPNFKLIGGGCEPWFSISQRGRRIFMSKKNKKEKESRAAIPKSMGGLDFPCSLLSISSDIRIDFYHKTFAKKMFTFQFNTAFAGTHLTLHKRDLDVACDDKDNKHFHKNFKVEVILKTEHQLVSSAEDSIRASMSSDNIAEMRRKLRSTCCFCRQPIQSDEVSVDEPSRSFHWDCMKCDICHKSLHGEPNCVVAEGSIKCSDCEDSFFYRCTSCNGAVTQDEARRYGDRMWHPACFRCCACQEPLMYSHFHLFQDNLYCNDHLPTINKRMRRSTNEELPDKIELLALASLFPSIRHDILKDILDKCNNNVAETVDYIKAKGFEMMPENLNFKLESAKNLESSSKDPNHLFPNPLRDPKYRSHLSSRLPTAHVLQLTSNASTREGQFSKIVTLQGPNEVLVDPLLAAKQNSVKDSKERPGKGSKRRKPKRSKKADKEGEEEEGEEEGEKAGEDAGDIMRSHDIQKHEEYVWAHCISSYPKLEGDPLRQGSPICDQFCVHVYENRTVTALADGCGWGHASCEAAQKAVDAFMDFMRSKLPTIRTVRDAGNMLLTGVANAHDKIVENKKPDEASFIGTTTFFGGVLLQLPEASSFPAIASSPDQVQVSEAGSSLSVSEAQAAAPASASASADLADSSLEGGASTSSHSPRPPVVQLQASWVYVFASVGDIKGFRYSVHHNKVFPLIASRRQNPLDPRDSGGRIGPQLFDNSPDLANLSVDYILCDEGDFVFVTSDGVHDNLDPQLMGFSPHNLGLNTDDWYDLMDEKEELEVLKSNWACHFLDTQIIGRIHGDITAEAIGQALMKHALALTEASRTWMETPKHRNDEQPAALEFPGKMDHTTCVCFRVGLNYPSKPTAKAQARVAPSALVSETADPLSEDMDHFLRSLTGQAGEPLLDSSTCHGCHQAIEEGAQVVWANCYPYHSDHFKCVMCGVGLAGSFFHPKGTDVACEKCIDKEARGHICAACRKPLKARRSIHALGMFWHPEHFKCSKCGMHLEGEGGFFEHAGDLYCQADHKLINAEKDLCFDGEDDLVDLPPQSTEEKAASKKAEEKGSKKAQRSARDDSGADSARKASSGSMSARRKGSVRATASGPLARSVSLVGKGFTTPSSENFPRRRPTPGASLLSSSPQSPALQSDVCPHCNKRVKSGGVVVMGRRYHKDHLRCTACKVHLSDGYFVRDSELFCESHYSAAKPSFAEDRLLADIKADRRMSSPNLSGMLKRQRKGSAGERDAKI